MGRTDFNPEWYGAQAKVLTSNEDQMVVDYGVMVVVSLKVINCLMAYNFAFSILKQMNL